MAELVRTVGRYGIVREIGRGGMAVVHLARQTDLDRPVALKELAAFHANDPDFARRFVRESRLAGSLMHPNVVTVFDFFEEEGTAYIAMEYVERGSLRPYVGKMTAAQIGGVLEGLLAGLAAAEQRGIVHRDLKPENLMVTADGGIKIADFGIAKATTEVTGTSAFVTATGATVGTPHYMAPEQAMAKEVGPWTDIYSVGCIAYELHTGRPPFIDADNPMAILMRHINEPMPAAADVAGVDPDVSAWIARLTAKDPARRPGTAEQAWEELEEVLIATLGPRWRRGARLGDPAPRVPGPATPPPDRTLPPVEGIDYDGEGPDTGGEFETFVPRSTVHPPVAEPPAPPPPPPTPPPVEQPPGEPTPEPMPAARAAEPAPPPERSTTSFPLGRAGAAGLVAALLVAVIAENADRWNLWAVASPLEVAGAMAIAWVAAVRRDPFAAGALTGTGVLLCVATLGLTRFAFERLGAFAGLLALVALAASVAILVAGARRVRPESGAIDPATLLLGLAGGALIVVALFTRYDGFSSLWSEVPEGTSAEFFFEPAVAAALILAALVLARGQAGAGILVAVGTLTALHFAGVIVAAWRAIGEVGEIRAAGFIGALGGLLVLAAGAYDARR